MDDASRSQSRRHWLLRALETTISISVLVIAFPILWFLKPRKATQPTGALEVVAPYRVNQLVPDAQGNWPPPFDFGGKPCLLIKTQEGEIRAFNAVCTHTDCTVMFRPKKHDIFCNCHNGVYNLGGGNVSGPPPRPLEAYKVTLRGKPGQEEILVSRS
jgi:Rieske Fe-S protein